MPKCPTCQRELPLSGKCPVCQKNVGGSSGFSLKELLAKTATIKNIQASDSQSVNSQNISKENIHATSLPTSNANIYNVDYSADIIDKKFISNRSTELYKESQVVNQSVEFTDKSGHFDMTHSDALNELFKVVEEVNSEKSKDSNNKEDKLESKENNDLPHESILALFTKNENSLNTQSQSFDVYQAQRVNTSSKSEKVPIFKTLINNTEIIQKASNKNQSFDEQNKSSIYDQDIKLTLGKPGGNITNLAKSQASAISELTSYVDQSNTTKSSVSQIEQKQEDDTNYEIFRADVSGYGDEEMEIAVLSAILNDAFILNSALSKGLIADLFSSRNTKAICKAILGLREESKEVSIIDKIVIKNKLRQMGMYDTNVQQLLEKVAACPSPTLDQVLNYLEIMKENALKRKLKEISLTISNYVDKPQASNTLSIESFTNKIIQELREVQKAKTTKRISLIREEMKEIMKDIERREETGEIDIIGFSCEPFHYLNIALSGFRKGFMYAIAGAPRRGKTTFTLELATAVATNCKIPVLFFTYEQTKRNLTYRLIAKESRLNPDTLQRKKIKSDTIMDAKFMGGWKKMQAYMDYFYIIEATKADTVDRIRSYAYNVMQDFNTEDIMIFVDYIQKMPLNRDYRDEKFKVEEISTELKALSIELNNPIMTISSLSKEGCMIDATPNDERPTLYHCKGSGDLEYDLDCAMIQAKDWGDTKELYTQLQHKAEELGKDPTRVPKVDVVNLYLDKNRDAPEGIYSVLQYLFFIEDNKFIELGPKYEDDRYRFSKIENVLEQLIQNNYIVFYDRDKNSSYNKGRVQIKLKNV